MTQLDKMCFLYSNLFVPNPKSCFFSKLATYYMLKLGLYQIWVFQYSAEYEYEYE